MYRFFVIGIFLVVSCSTTKKINYLAETNQCEKASHKLLDDKVTKAPGRYSKASLGYLITYPLVTAGAAIDIVYFTTNLSIGIMANCPYLVAAILGSTSESPELNRCTDGDYLPLPEFEPISYQVYQSTEKMRCVDMTNFSKRARSVARCFEKRDSDQDLIHAQMQLQSLAKNIGQFKCMDESEQKELAYQYQGITKKLKAKNLPYVNFLWPPELRIENLPAKKF